MLLYKFYKYSQFSDKRIDESVKNVTDIAFSEVKEHILQQQAAEGASCANVIIKDMDGKTLSLDVLSGDNSPRFCFRFKETDCDACINRITRTLSGIAKHFPENGIVILSGYDNARQFYAYAQTINLKFSVYNANKFNIDLDEHSLPYFFVLTTDGRMRNIFIPDENDTKFTSQYVDVVKKKYWGEKQMKLVNN
ncbi:MAG: hypothetical protein LBQ28_01565 [Prevotellaceae bacterium]|nr:hypothetical protein [Prevotellaceae bacterium]